MSHPESTHDPRDGHLPDDFHGSFARSPKSKALKRRSHGGAVLKSREPGHYKHVSGDKSLSSQLGIALRKHASSKGAKDHAKAMQTRFK